MNVPVKAIVSAVLASLMFASMGVAVRYSSEFISHEMTVFLRNIFGLVFLTPLLVRFGINNLGTSRLSAHLVRSVSGLIAMYCFFYAIAHLHLAEAVLLNYSAPIFIAIIALLWLGERPTLNLVIAIIIGFTGLCFILKPGIDIFQGAAWIGLLSAIFAAFAMVTIRNLSSTEPTIRIVFYFSLTSTIISAIPLIWKWQVPDLKTLLAMFFAGIAATLGQLLLTRAYSLAPAAQIGPYTYTTVLFAAIYGWIFWMESPDIFTLAGAVLVIIAGSITFQKQPVAKIVEPD